ncbi:MAG: GGDEF domain-containing protein [Acidobacteriota bacterium]
MTTRLTADDEASVWKRLLRRLTTAPDPDLVHAGLGGEWTIASIRLLTVLLVLYFPLRDYFESPEPGDRMVLLVGVAALAEALVLYSAVKRSWGRGWIGFFSGILDATLVTAALWIFLRLNRPWDAIEDVVIFPIYFLVIGATSLRYDWRVSVLTGTVAIAQYAALVSFAVWNWELQNFSWTPQIARLLLLAMATALSVTLVLRAIEQRTLSNRDRLTLLANRGFFDESLARIGAIASRTGDPVAIAMIDIDHFKRFNDTYGHLAGDEALRVVASKLQDSFRTTDLVARYGGEEFSCLFPGMGVDDAMRRLEVVRRSIEELQVGVGSKETTRVTVSIGVAVWPLDGLNLEQTLALADQRLYQAKSGGRNRVIGRAPSAVSRPDDAASPSQAPAVAPAG